MSGHAPGPWNIYPNAHDDFVIRKMFPDGLESHSIARCHSGAANARRIVACANACEGIDTEYLEKYGLPGFAKQISDLVEQRDQLLEALRPIAKYGEISAEIIDVARAAIAKATGK